ncbi:threonine/serine exporter family protein [Desulfogranum japonicum]|uniref:threonine/serine ThrE exporter family protein n=1 Tax=Desulfogranum japonicum TaxID=231447 RepID=UPI000426A20D|nr:threonine/serine exporter family protein [Desulfogranum japonicum]
MELLPSTNQEIKKLGMLLLRCASMMQAGGSNTSRIRNSIDRIAHQFRVSAELFITHQAIFITLTDANEAHVFSAVKRNKHPGVNFRVVSGISRMSWKINTTKWSLQEIQGELDRLETLPRFAAWTVTCMVGLSGAGFCGLSGGRPSAMLVACMSTVAGQCIRHQFTQRKINPYFCTFFAALGATLISGLPNKLFPDMGFEVAFITSVLFLIPGVPLFNAFTDLLEGNILNGCLRAVNGLLISFMIALGFLLSLFIFKF